MKNKAYTTFEILIGISLAGLFLIVAIPIIGKIFGAGNQFIDDVPCYESVQQQAFLNTNVRLFTSGLKCPIKNVELPKSITNDETKKVVADEMMYCWNKFGKGELELFTTSLEGGDAKRFCHVCTHIVIPAENVKVKSTEFLSYLETNNPQKNEKTYSELLYAKVHDAQKYFDDTQIQKPETDTTMIDSEKNKDYALVFKYVKGRSEIEDELKGIKAASPALAGQFVGVGIVYIGLQVVGVAVIGTFAWPIVAVGVTVTIISTYIGTLFAGYAREPPSWMANMYVVPYSPETLTSLECEIAET